MSALRAMALATSLVVTGFAGVAWAGVPTGVSVQFTITTYDPWPTVDQIQTYTLTCDPVGGTMPLASRVCDDIDQHPAAMLTPRLVGQQVACGGVPNSPTVAVSATANGVTSVFGPRCDNPGGVAANVYWAAVRNDERTLDLLEPQLACDEDPALYLQPTFPSIFACSNGLWTPRAAQMIQISERSSAIAALAPAKLFPQRIGVQACALPVGTRAAGPRTVSGQCGVLENDSGSTSTVTFVEYWGAAGVLAPSPAEDKEHPDRFSLKGFATTAPGDRHNWRVVIRNSKVVDTSQSGAVPPQLQH